MPFLFTREETSVRKKFQKFLDFCAKIYPPGKTPDWRKSNLLGSCIDTGFPKRGRLVGEGDSLGKMAKNCIKITKSAFLGQSSGRDMGEQANFLGSRGGSPPVPSTRGNPGVQKGYFKQEKPLPADYEQVHRNLDSSEV